MIKGSVDSWAHGSGEIDALRHGKDLVWPMPPLRPMGMDFSGSASVASNATADVASGWSARPGYPDTEISDGYMLIFGGDGVVDISAGASPTNTYLTWRVMHWLAETQGWAQRISSTSATASAASVEVKQGDRLKMTISSSFSNRTITSGYLYYDVVS